jgi:hypothetical protein
MTFVNAIQKTPVTARTANGMKAQVSSTHPVVDLFFQLGASRGKDITVLFERAFQFDTDLTMKVALWARDVRGGAGERQLFRDILMHLENLHPDMLEKVIPHVPIFGRWDDLLVFKTTAFKNKAYTFIGDALREGNGLAAKWMPRKGPIAVEIREFFGMTPKQYRKSLVSLTNVVETKMCAKDWDSIEFGKLPSLASARYQKAFGRNAPSAYTAYKEALTKGTATINAGAVYPYDVVKSIKMGDATVAKAQWEALPDFMGDANILPLVDVSGSMTCPVGGNANLTCMDVAVSLGLYCSDKNKGAFKDAFLTFSERSKLEVLRGDILSKYAQLVRADWGMSTNLHAAFDAILKVATSQNVPHSDMPEYVLILSDMQFNCCTHYNDSAIEMIERKYKAAGYEVPKVVFWNLNASNNTPVSFDKNGTALVSGFSPSVMKAILSGKEFTPEGIMRAAVDIERYSVL